MTRLCIVRHGETAWNAEHRVQGQLDVPLSAVGRAQARAVARALSGEKFCAIYSSDLSRALETARATSGPLGVEPLLDERLRERHYGIFQTLRYADVKVQFPDDYARFLRHDPEFDFRTGESLRDFNRRSLECIADLVARHPGEDVLVFTHGGILDMLYRHVTGMGLAAERDFRIPNCAINRLESGTQGWQIGCWADEAHLEGALDDLREE